MYLLLKFTLEGYSVLFLCYMHTNVLSIFITLFLLVNSSFSGHLSITDHVPIPVVDTQTTGRRSLAMLEYWTPAGSCAEVLPGVSGRHPQMVGKN